MTSMRPQVVFVLLSLLVAAVVAQPTVSLSLAPEQGAAEDSGTPLVFTFTSTANGPLTVMFAITGDGTPGGDFSVSTGAGRTVTIPLGATTATLTLIPTADAVPEATETAIVTIQNDAAYNVGNPSVQTAFIVNDDGTAQNAGVVIPVNSAPEAGGSPLRFYFVRSGTPVDPITISFSRDDGTAVFGADWTGAANPENGLQLVAGAGASSIIMPAGQHFALLTVTPVDNNAVAAAKTVVFTVTGTGYTIAPAAATGTITDDDPKVLFSLNPTSITEGGAAKLVYTVTRTGPTAANLGVTFNVAGTAVFAQDYTAVATAGVVNIAGGNGQINAGQASLIFEVTATPDATPEAEETVSIALTGAGALPFPPAPLVGKIIDADGPTVTISVTPGSVSEAGMTEVVATITRSIVTAQALTVNLAVTGTATPGVDYAPAIAAAPVIPANMASVQVKFTPTDEATIEPDETVIMTISPGVYKIGTPDSAQTVIINDDGNTVTLGATPLATNEDGGDIVYEFRRTNSLAQALVVSFSVAGTATFGTDYTLTGTTTVGAASGTVTFPANTNVVTVVMNPTADTVSEADETVILQLTAGAGYALGTAAPVTTTIRNDDLPTVTLAKSGSGSVPENSPFNLAYVFTRVGATTTSVNVKFTLGGTATIADNDFTFTFSSLGSNIVGTAGTIVIPAGQSQASIIFVPTGDATVEPDETITISLVNDANYQVGTTETVATTILDDDGATSVRIAVSPATAREGAGTPFVFTLTRSGLPAVINVVLVTSGTATTGVDYPNVASPVAFTAADFTKTVSVTPIDDQLIEADETLTITVTAAAGYVPAAAPNNAATATIENDDPSVSVTVAPTSTLEASGVPLSYTFTRTGPTAAALPVNIKVAGTASATDFQQLPTGSLITIPVNQASIVMLVTPIDDVVAEPDETVIVSVEPGTGYVVATTPMNVATGTITNDDGSLVSISVAPANVTEDGATNAVYTFTRVGSTGNTLLVSFGVSGTATFGSDYSQTGADTFSATAGTVRFGVGLSVATVTIDPSADVIIEPTETVILTILPSGLYTVNGTASSTLQITDDDSNIVTVAVSPTSVNEDPSATLTYTFTRTGVTTQAITVGFTVSGTATLGSDYTTGGFTGASGSVVFGLAQSTVSFVVSPLTDVIDEQAETIVITALSGANYTIGSPSSASATINPPPGESIGMTVTPSTIAEGTSSTVTWTITRAAPVAKAVTVRVQLAGTATINQDFTVNTANLVLSAAGPTSIVIPPSVASTTIEVLIIDDTISEVDETISLTLLNATDNSYTVTTPTAVVVTVTDNDGVNAPGGVFTDTTSTQDVFLGDIIPVGFKKRDVLATDTVLRETVANFLNIGVQFVLIVNNFDDHAVVRIGSVTTGLSADRLAFNLVVGVNGRDPRLSLTVLRNAYALLAPKIEEVEQQIEPLTIIEVSIPPPSPTPPSPSPSPKPPPPSTGSSTRPMIFMVASACLCVALLVIA